MERVSESSFYSRPSTATKEPTDKKLKATSSEMNNTELRKLDRWDPHINAIFEILDITEVGRKDDLLATADLIKLAQISSKYFFLCMIEEGMPYKIYTFIRSCFLSSRIMLNNFTFILYRSNWSPVLCETSRIVVVAVLHT